MAIKVHSAFVVSMMMFMVASCSEPEPSAVVDRWTISSTAKNKYLFQAVGHYADQRPGVFHRNVETVDERGCHSQHYVENTFEKTSSGDAASFILKMPITSKTRLARAQFSIDFWDMEQAVEESGRRVFTEEQVIDSSLNPPDFPEKPCNTSQTDSRKLAETDPEAADAEAIGSMSRNEVIATAINTAGYLCARVTGLSPQGDNLVATCIEYRNGKGRAKYRIDTGSMTVTPF